MTKNNLKTTSEVLVLQSIEDKQVLVPEKAINLKKALAYYNNFYNTRLSNNSKDNTRSIWFEFELLKDYFKRANLLCSKKNIEITRFVFLLGATKEGKRNVLLAPATYDERLDLHRAFSIDNDKITYLHRFAGENHSDIKNFDNLHSNEQSLVLSNSGLISSSEAIFMYNNYHDSILAPSAETIPFDTRFVYYEKGGFESYLSFLAEQSITKNLPITGINVIFGTKDEKEGIYSNLVTLFFAPTKDEAKNISFSSFDKPEKNCLNLAENKWNDTLEQTATPTMFNRGTGVPPPFSWD